jgi:DinB family protein
MSRLELAIEQIVFARKYTLELLDHTPTTDWFRMPAGSVSHIGWQVGHLAFSEYRMALWRIRAERPEDGNLFSPEFRRQFGANSVPDADPAKHLAPAQIRATLDRVHEQALRELVGLTESDLDQPVPHPHKFANTKLSALLWCSQHEMLHAGQIGLLRRHLGYPPLW